MFSIDLLQENKSHCSYFLWVDEVINNRVTKVESEEGKVNQLERNMEVMRIHMNEMQMKMKEVMNW